MRKQSKFLVGLSHFDDVIALPFQIVVSLLSAKNYRLNAVLRDFECLVIGSWIVTILATIYSTYSVSEKFLMILVSVMVVMAEKNLLFAHHNMCKLGWSREVAELYRTSALRYKDAFLIYRVLGLVAFLSFPALSLLTAPEWQFVDVTTYLALLIYVYKFYVERSSPTDDLGLDPVAMRAGEFGR